MSVNTIRERFETIIKEQLGVTEDDFKSAKSIFDLGGDSLDEVEILMAIEEEFEIPITDDEAEATEGELIKMLNTLQKKLGVEITDLAQ